MLSHRDRQATQQSVKIGPPLQGLQEKPARCVASLARGTTPRFAPLLASGLLLKIMTPLSNPERL
jgi:hypothetical protein